VPGCCDALPGIPQSDKLFNLNVFDIMKRSGALSNSTFGGDLSMQFDLNQGGTLAILEAIGDQHGMDGLPAITYPTCGEGRSEIRAACAQFLD
jgi:hypothetical protein